MKAWWPTLTFPQGDKSWGMSRAERRNSETIWSKWCTLILSVRLQQEFERWLPHFHSFIVPDKYIITIIINIINIINTIQVICKNLPCYNLVVHDWFDMQYRCGTFQKHKKAWKTLILQGFQAFSFFVWFKIKMYFSII